MRSDPDQNAVYAAERASGLAKTSLVFHTQEEAQGALFVIMNDPRFKRFFPNAPVGIDLMFTSSRSCSWSSDDGRIRLGLQGRNMYILLHELAHQVSGSDEGHGVMFRHHLVLLVSMFMTFFDIHALRNAFASASLSTNPFNA